MKVGTDAHIFVGAAVESAPEDFAGFDIEGGKLAANAEFAAAVTDKNDVLDDDWRHGDGFAELDVADGGLPGLLAGVGVDGDGMGVKRVVDDLSVGIDGAAINSVAAGDADGSDIGIGPEDPLLRKSGLGDVEGDQVVGIRRDHVEGAVDHQRLTFMAVRNSGGSGGDDVEVLHIAGVDLRKRAVAGVGVIAGRLRPLAVRDGRDEMNAGLSAGNVRRHAAIRNGLLCGSGNAEEQRCTSCHAPD